ncbi:hypothetical protein EDC04DRAFT_2770364 [Pisolithus marmoratus]|nr:hypothetical protein EDC04DRAFT_2770364 [Pisolithus marmoratus]
MIAEWLTKNYGKDVKLTGIIYTHRIIDNRMSGSVCDNLDLFKRLCGGDSAQCVRLVSTMWDNQTPENATIYEQRVSQLEGNFWKPLILKGARHERFFNTQKSIWDIVTGLVPPGFPTTKLGEETGGPQKKLKETSAKEALHSHFQWLLLEYRDILQRIGDALAAKDPNAIDRLEAEYRKMDAEVQKTVKALEADKVPSARHIALFSRSLGKRFDLARRCTRKTRH